MSGLTRESGTAVDSKTRSAIQNTDIDLELTGAGERSRDERERHLFEWRPVVRFPKCDVVGVLVRRELVLR